MDQRYEIISAFGAERDLSRDALVAGRSWQGGDSGKLAPEIRGAIQDVLIAMLADTDERTGMSASWGEISFHDPRICDIAGYVLHDRWPDDFPFNSGCSLLQRERQCITILNPWRQRRGLLPLDLPALPEIPRIDDAVAQTLLDNMLAARDDDRTAAIEAYRNLGPGALPLLLAHLGKNPPGDVAADLAGLASQIGCIIRSVVVAADSPPPDAALRARLDAMIDRPLCARSFVNCLIETAAAPPAGATGIKLTALRHAEIPGVELELTLPGKKAFQGGTQKGWQTRTLVTVNGDSIHNSSGSSSREYGLTFEAHQDLAEAIDQAVAAPPGSAFRIRTSLIAER